MSVNKYKYLLFDADNTLLDFDKAERVAIKNTVRSVGIEPTEEMCIEYSRINLSVWKALERGEIDKASLKIKRFEIFAKRFSIDCEPKALADTYLDHLSHQGFLKKGAKEVLSALSDRFHIYIVTNGIGVVQRGRIAASGLEGLFEKMYISDDIGYEKPDQRFFDAVFEDIGISDKSEVLVIGDSLTSDIRGAVNAHVDCCYLAPPATQMPADPRPTYMINDVFEIFDILDNN